MTWRVIVGTVSMVLTIILLGYVAVTEQSRMETFATAYAARDIETGAALFENNCQSCHGNKGQGVPGKGPQLNYHDMFNGNRTLEAGWSGTVQNFVRLTIAAGRPQRSAKFADAGFAEPMPTWGEEYGGPLRKDQVNALTAYVMNWGKAYEGLPVASPTPIDVPMPDITAALPAGDAARGAEVAKAKACTACHIDAPTGPAWLASASPDGTGIGERAATRITEAGYTGKATTAEQYLYEAIIHPSDHLVESPDPAVIYATNGVSAMPPIYATTISKQDLADLIAYLLTMK